MKRPRALPMLEHRRAELETCTYCPKLCNAACPVSNAERSETVTTWGKMRGTHAVARGERPATPDYAALAWACTGCFACRERCDHRNEAAQTLFEARAEFVARGVAPEGSERARRGFAERVDRVRARAEQVAGLEGADAAAPLALIVGCEYLLGFRDVVKDAISAARRLFGPLRIVSECCGYPLEAAGDPAGAKASRQRLLAQIASAKRTLAVDAGCAYALADHGVEPFSRAAARALAGKGATAAFGDQTLRYHDSCLLGRGLGEYDAPRTLVALGSRRGAQEFFWRREHARCSGGGGLLPLTRPATSAEIARQRLDEHARLGGGTIVTACAQSLRRFRASGADVLDLVNVVARVVG